MRYTNEWKLLIFFVIVRIITLMAQSEKILTLLTKTVLTLLHIEAYMCALFTN